MSWSPNVADLPVTGEKPISSQKWKNVVYDIYNKLNITRLLNTGVVAPVDAETGMPWVDTANGITLKLYNALDLQWHALAFYSDLLASNVVVTPSGNLSASDVQAAVIELQADIDTRLLSADVATEATANKVLRLNADSKLPASITGDADTVDGKHATAFQEVSQKDQPGGYAGLDNNGALNSKIRSTPLYDFNTATIGGLYYWGSSTLNAPVPGGGTALVIDRLTNSDLTQIAINVTTRSLYIRVSRNTSNTEWSDWKHIDAATWGNISGTLSDQTDLQAALNGKQSVSEKDQPGGYAGLDANGKIDSEWIKDASETVKGVVELATSAEVLAGEDTEKAVTPAGFKAAFGEFYPVGVTPTYVDANNFTVSGDLTAIFTQGRVLKITDTGGTFNAICATSAYDSGTELTTVTVAGDTIDSGISVVLYAVQQVTGAIWESGSNANGNYVRYADGTQVCTGEGTWTTEAVFFKAINPTMPAAFNGIENKAWGNLIFDSAPVKLTICGAFSPSSGVTVYTVDGTNLPAGMSITYRWIVIGRWY